jgi:hypothetical protein
MFLGDPGTILSCESIKEAILEISYKIHDVVSKT